MTVLGELLLKDRLHWYLHLGAVVKDTPSVKTQVDTMLQGGELPNIKHPADIHAWLEQPERRIYLNG